MSLKEETQKSPVEAPGGQLWTSADEGPRMQKDISLSKFKAILENQVQASLQGELPLVASTPAGVIPTLQERCGPWSL